MGFGMLFAAARNLAGTVPWVLATDGLQAFCHAARRAFWMRDGFRLVHIRDIHLKNRFSHNNNNNNTHERLNGEFKDNTKTVRGFRAENPALVQLMIIRHTFSVPTAALAE